MLATNAASAAGVSPLRRLQAVAWTLATLEALAVAMERPADEVVVFDEGPLQRALALIAPGYAPDATGRLVRSAPEVALVLNLRADELTLMRRLDARARAIGRTDRYAGLSRKERLKTLRGDSRLLAEVAVAARAAGRSVIDIDTSDTSPDPVRSILDILGRLEP